LEIDIFKSIKIPVPSIERQKEIDNNKRLAQQFITGIVKAHGQNVNDQDDLVE
jgi:hypothetical protein